MKKGIIVAAIIAAVVAAVVFAVWFTVGKPLDKVITAKGYAISVPDGWVSDAEGTLTDKNGTVVGKFILVNEEPDFNNTVSYSGVSAKGDVRQEDITDKIVKNTFESENGKTVQYFIRDIPNPEPYAISLTFFRSGVGALTCDRIAGSLQIPELGSNPPPKNIAAPAYADVGESRACKLAFTDGSAAVKNMSLIDDFIKRQKKLESTGLDVLSYKEDENGGESLKTWSHIESDKGRGYLYTYYDRGDGIYTYDNNPLIFDSITKELVEDKEITSYRLKTGETETTRLLEIPMNLYRDKAETLVSLKTAESTDESLMKILEQIMTPEQLKTITAAKTPDGIKILYHEEGQVDRSKLSKDAAVLFSLASDIQTVTVEDANGETYVLNRNDILNDVETPPETATATPEDFAKFAEELESIPPAQPESSGGEGNTDTESGSESESNSVADGEVIYSATIVIPSDKLVKHPDTGEMVPIGPYAEQMGFGAYLGKPITCTIKKAGRGYLATASSGGSVIMSYPLSTEADVQNAISQIQAYS